MTTRSSYTFPGIYTITCEPTGYAYVGKAKKIQRRWTHHKWAIRSAKHHNKPLCDAWDEYGEKNFIFDVAADLSHVPADELDDALSDMEGEILKLHPKNFNLAAPGHGGLKASPELRAHFGAKATARWADPEYRARVTASMQVAASNPEHQRMRGLAISRGMSTPEFRAKRSTLSKEMWSDPQFKAERAAERAANWQDRAYRDGQSASRRAVWQDPEKRARREVGLKASWADPEVRARRQAAMQAARGKNSPVEDAALAFLKGNPTQGFTAAEIWRATEQLLGGAVSRAAPRLALVRMSGRGEVIREGNLYRLA